MPESAPSTLPPEMKTATDLPFCSCLSCKSEKCIALSVSKKSKRVPHTCAVPFLFYRLAAERHLFRLTADSGLRECRTSLLALHCALYFCVSSRMAHRLITHQFTEGSSHVSPRMAHHASIQGRLITRQSPDGSSLLRSAGMKTLSPCGCRASWASFTASSQNMRWESISSFPLLSTRS